MSPVLLIVFVVLFVGFIAFFPKWRRRRAEQTLIDIANDPVKARAVRNKTLEKRRLAEAKVIAEQLKKDILATTKKLAERGEADTDDMRLVDWFKSRGYEVEKALYSNRNYTIKIPGVTEKEISDLIVK